MAVIELRLTMADDVMDIMEENYPDIKFGDKDFDKRWEECSDALFDAAFELKDDIETTIFHYFGAFIIDCEYNIDLGL